MHITGFFTCFLCKKTHIIVCARSFPHLVTSQSPLSCSVLSSHTSKNVFWILCILTCSSSRRSRRNNFISSGLLNCAIFFWTISSIVRAPSRLFLYIGTSSIRSAPSSSVNHRTTGALCLLLVRNPNIDTHFHFLLSNYTPYHNYLSLSSIVWYVSMLWLWY